MTTPCLLMQFARTSETGAASRSREADMRGAMRLAAVVETGYEAESRSGTP